MRTFQEYENVLTLHTQGYNKSKIAKMTGIPRGTITTWMTKGFCTKAKNKRMESEDPTTYLKTKEKAYAFLLGLYLGDGHIDKQPRTYRLRIFNDTRYPNLNDEIKKTLQLVFPGNKVNSLILGCTVIYMYSNLLPMLFPQHGKGTKNEREIILSTWQQHVLHGYEKDFIKGLFLSDGCRFTTNGYTKYEFCNTSFDITRICSEYLSSLNILHNINMFFPKEKNRKTKFIIRISKQEQVNLLDSFIGVKN